MAQPESTEVIPPLVALRKDDTELLVFESADHLEEHDQAGTHAREELFPSEEWDLFDASGRRLTVERDGPRIAEVRCTEGAESQETLNSRIRAVVGAVKARVADGVQDGTVQEYYLDDINRIDSSEGDLIAELEGLRVWRHPADEEHPGEDAGGWWHYMFSPHH